MGLLLKEYVWPRRVVRHDRNVFLSNPSNLFFECFHDAANPATLSREDLASAPFACLPAWLAQSVLSVYSGQAPKHTTPSLAANIKRSSRMRSFVRFVRSIETHIGCTEPYDCKGVSKAKAPRGARPGTRPKLSARG